MTYTQSSIDRIWEKLQDISLVMLATNHGSPSCVDISKNDLSNALTSLTEEKVCEWRYDKHDEAHGTSCDKYFSYMGDDARLDPDFQFCPYCGGKIEVKESKNEKE